MVTAALEDVAVVVDQQQILRLAELHSQCDASVGSRTSKAVPNAMTLKSQRSTQSALTDQKPRPLGSRRVMWPATPSS